METIRMYIENMFARLPQTAELLKAKQELLSMMEDKYNELKADGRNENEAVGMVIAEFGNVDEILESLHIGGSAENAGEQDDGSCRVGKAEAQNYISAVRRRSLFLAVGTMLCILGPAVFMLCFGAGEYIPGSTAFFSAFGLNRNSAVAAGLVCMFIFITCAVVLFIIGGMSTKEFEQYKSERIVLTPDARYYVQNMKKNNGAAKAVTGTVAVVLCILSPLPLIVSFCLYQGIPGYDWLYYICAEVLLLCVAAAVVLMIFGDGTARACRRLLLNGSFTSWERRGVRGMHRGRECRRAVHSVFWPLLLLVYLLTSIITRRWDITWIIWPAAAILSSVMWRTVSCFHTFRDDDEY